MQLLDGKKLSQKILEELKQEVSESSRKLRLAIVVLGENPAVKKFIEQKKKAAEFIGVDTRVFPFAENIATNDLRKRLTQIVHEEKNSGVIIQLPLPSQINTQYILNSVIPQKDADVLSSRAVGDFAVGRSPVFPPVAGAIKTFLEEYKIDYKNKYFVLLGAGTLVGKPAALWLLNEKCTFSVLRTSTPNPEEFLQKADIIISGIGVPKFIKGDIVKEGAVVIDAGTSESEGKLAGDADFDSVSKKASFITPVPGGVGPVTVAMLFKNLITLNKKND